MTDNNYPAIFEFSFGYLLSNEGGFEENAHDSGGATKFGISKVQFPSIDIANLTIDDAKRIYFSVPPKDSSIPFWVPLYPRVNDPRVIAKIFDMAVHMGPGTAHEIVQMSLGMKNPTPVFGQITLGLVNAHDPDLLLLELAARCALKYSHILSRNPDDDEFALGWFRRAVKVPR